MVRCRTNTVVMYVKRGFSNRLLFVKTHYHSNASTTAGFSSRRPPISVNFLGVLGKSQLFFHLELRYRTGDIYVSICIYVSVIYYTPLPPFYCVHKPHYHVYCVHNNVLRFMNLMLLCFIILCQKWRKWRWLISDKQLIVHGKVDRYENAYRYFF